MTVLFSVQHDDIEEKISSNNLPEYVFEFPLPFRREEQLMKIEWKRMLFHYVIRYKNIPFLISLQ
jgi:hypothetical protein